MGNPKDNIKNPIVVLIMSLVCFILGLLNMMRFSNEVNEYKKGGEKVPSGILCIIPLYNILVAYKIFTGIKELQGEKGIPEGEQINPIVAAILCCILSIGMMQAQAALNKVWEKM